MDKNSNLNNAKKNKNDEFYTQLCDIEGELRHYKEHFKDKVVFCNCDDPYESNFFKYFVLNFNSLGLKKLITTGYSTSPIVGQEINLFEDEIETPRNQPYSIFINEVKDMNNDGRIDLEDIKILLKEKHNCRRKLYGDNVYLAGDFRSKECLSLLKKSDIVVTNPPFSLFREYINQLIEYKKKFIVWANNNAIIDKDIFPLFQNEQIWLGYMTNATCVFSLPQNYVKWDIKLTLQINDGKKYGKVSAISIFTNLDITKRHEHLITWKKYNNSDYPLYVNYNAINVDKISDIPSDYFGMIGVPVTYMSVHNPDDFEIIGFADGNLGKAIGVGCAEDVFQKYYRQNKALRRGKVFYIDELGFPKKPYSRIIIRRKNNNIESEENSNEN